MKKMKKDNKGFSLVELIIVIAIMAVLIGVLAPQYLKYVNNSKVSTDATNAQEVATAVNVAISDEVDCFPASGTTPVFADVCAAAGVDVPVSKLGGTWDIEGDNTDGVSKIYLTVDGSKYECYPNPDNDTNGINDKTNGLKQ